jgi:tetratricopeptide (TPR) repeat protein
VQKLSAESGVAASSIRSYEREGVVPGLEVRKKLVRALSLDLVDLDALAAALQEALAALAGRPESVEHLAVEVAAGLALDFQRSAVPLLERLMAARATPQPASSDEDVRALAPVVRKLDAQELQALVEQAPSLRRWAFVQLVGEESAWAASTDAKKALALAAFALQVAEQVPGEEDWASQVHAWAYLGNARRVANKLAAAEEAFTRSKHLQAERPEGRPELPEPWRLLDLEASLRIELRQGPEALRLLDQATRLAPQTGPVQAHLLCIRARALYRMDDLEGSIATLRQGLAQIGRETAPRLYFQLQSNLVERLTETGQAAEAAERFPELRRLQGHVGNGLNDLRLQWLEGKIDAGLGRLDRAIEILTQVRAAFAREDLRYDEAQAGVELAGLYLQKGRTADAKRLVLAMAPVFHAQGVPEEAAKALALFRRAVEQEAATPALASRVVTFLRRAQHDPELRFEEAA